MTAENPDFDNEMAKLAKAIVQTATLDATPFDERVDAFKALTTYYALRLRHKPDDDDTADGGFSFAGSSFAHAAEEKPNGGPDVRSRSRRSS